MKRLIILGVLSAFITGCTPSVYYGSYQGHNCENSNYMEYNRARALCLDKANKIYLRKADRDLANRKLIKCNHDLKLQFCELELKFYAKRVRKVNMYDCAEAYDPKAKEACENLGFVYGNRRGRK